MCVKIFRMLHGIGEKIFKNLTKSLKEDGLASRIHGNTKRKPNHTLSFSSAELNNYTEQNGLLLAASSCGSSRILYGEGLIILNLEFIEMRDLMPEMWMRGDEVHVVLCFSQGIRVHQLLISCSGCSAFQ